MLAEEGTGYLLEYIEHLLLLPHMLKSLIVSLDPCTSLAIIIVVVVILTVR